MLRNKLLLLLLLLLLVVVESIKLCTYVVILPDDPTTILYLRSTPSITNKIFIQEGQKLPSDIILIADENGFIGQSLYYLIVNFLWILVPAIFLLLLVVSLIGKRKH